MNKTGAAPYLPSGRCLKVALTKWPPYVDGVNPTYTGWCIEMFDVIREKLKVCHEYLEPPDGLWGAQFLNGSWFGMMGMLHRKEVDVAIGPFGVTLARTTAADFGVPITATDHAVLYRRPHVEPDLLGFTKPFTLVVWAGVFASLLLVTLVALGLHALSPAHHRSRGLMATDAGNRDLSRSSSSSSPLWGYRALLSQDVMELRGGQGGRGMVGLWLLISFILGAVYKSNLKAMLIVPRVTVPFDSLEELVKQSTFPWTTAHGSIVQSFFEEAFKEEPTSIMGRGWRGISHLLHDAKDIIPTVMGGVAGLYTRHSSTYIMGNDFSEHGYCRLALTRGGYIAVQHSMGFPLGSPLRPVIDDLVYRLTEFGLVKKFIDKEMTNTSYCLVPPGREVHTELRPLAIGDFLGVFTLYGAGVVCSMAIFMAEELHHHHHHRHHQHHHHRHHQHHRQHHRHQ